MSRAGFLRLFWDIEEVNDSGYEIEIFLCWNIDATDKKNKCTKYMKGEASGVSHVLILPYENLNVLRMRTCKSEGF